MIYSNLHKELGVFIMSTMEEFCNKRVSVKWFSPLKGYGFCVSSDVEGDIFVHFSLVNQLSEKFLDIGDILVCDFVRGDHGLQVKKIHSIEHSFKHNAEQENNANIKKIEVIEGEMKWFNPAKGFGFAVSKENEDIFIHASLLKTHGLLSIKSGQKLLIKVAVSNKGLEAKELSIL